MSPDQEQLTKACEALAASDTALAQAYQVIGLPVWRSAPMSYETLARSVVYQQISTKAAGAIWHRLQDNLDICPPTIIATSEDKLRALGLSRPKIAHMRSIALALETGALNFDRLAASTPEKARKELVSVRGIGPWTAELFCLYALGELNALPTADIGLMESYRQLRGDDQRLDRKAFESAAHNWMPWRGVAAHLLWGWLNRQRGS